MGGWRRKELRQKNTKESAAREISPFFRRYESISNTLKKIGKETFKSILKETLKEVAKETFFITVGIAADTFIAPGMGTILRIKLKTIYEEYRLAHKAEKYVKLTKDYLNSNDSFFESDLSKEIVKDVSNEIIKGEIRTNTTINNFTAGISNIILNDRNTSKLLEEHNIDKEIFAKILSSEIKAALKGAGKGLVNKVMDKLWDMNQKGELENEERKIRRKY